MIRQEAIGIVKRDLKNDLAFLMYIVDKKCHVALIENTGIKKLIDECNDFINSATITNEHLKALNAATSLIASLRVLWRNNVDFCQQLKACNTGDFEYGKLSASGEHFYKDFEFEIWSAAHLIQNKVNVELPQQRDSNDILYEDVEIQCKHPDSFNRERIDKYLREFNSSLIAHKAFGVFAIAIEDCFQFQPGEFESKNDFEQYMTRRQAEIDNILAGVFDEVLGYTARIAGVFLTSTFYFYLIDTNDLLFHRMGNSVLCFRPDRPEIKDEHYRKAFDILECFNSSPTWITFKDQKLYSKMEYS